MTYLTFEEAYKTSKRENYDPKDLNNRRLLDRKDHFSDETKKKLFLNDVRTEICQDAGRDCPLPIQKNQTFTTSLWLVGKALITEAEQLEKKPEVLLCDRGISDILSHTYHLKTSNYKDRIISDLISTVCNKWLPSYDYIFVTHPNPKIPWPTSDKLSVKDRDHQMQLQELLEIILKENESLSPIFLPSDTDARVNAILSSVNNSLGVKRLSL